MERNSLESRNPDGERRCVLCTEHRCLCAEPLSLELRTYADNMLAEFRARVRCGMCRGRGRQYIPRPWGLRHVFEEQLCVACAGTGRVLTRTEAA